MKRLIYADNAATTKLDIEAFEAMRPYLLDEYGNASQPYSFARKPKKALKEARQLIAQCINADPDEIFFTSGGTESDNWAILGAMFQCEREKLVTTPIEHHAVLHACEVAERQGYLLKYIPVSLSGKVSEDEVRDIIDSNTALVSIMIVNNEIGTIQPIKELCAIAHENGALFHTDAVQAVGHINIDVKELGVDLLSASAHKFNGPKGIGFLYIKRGTPISSYINGGAQEFGMRAGTENVASIVGMAVALKNSCASLSSSNEHCRQLKLALIERLEAEGVDFILNSKDESVSNIISFSIRGASGEALLHRLDLMGIAISTGSACNSVNDELSHVIQAIGVDPNYAYGTIRVSFSKDNTIDEAISVAEAIAKAVKG